MLTLPPVRVEPSLCRRQRQYVELDFSFFTKVAKAQYCLEPNAVDSYDIRIVDRKRGTPEYKV